MKLHVKRLFIRRGWQMLETGEDVYLRFRNRGEYDRYSKREVYRFSLALHGKTWRGKKTLNKISAKRNRRMEKLLIKKDCDEMISRQHKHAVNSLLYQNW